MPARFPGVMDCVTDLLPIMKRNFLPMRSFGDGKSKTTYKSNKKRNKAKRKERRNAEEEEKDAMQLDKEENVEDEMTSQYSRRMEEEEEEEMPAHVPNVLTHPTRILGNPIDFRNMSYIDHLLYDIPYFLEKDKQLKDGSENFSYSGNNTKCSQKDGLKDDKFRTIIKNLVNSHEKMCEGTYDCPWTSSSNPFLKEMEDIAKSLAIFSREYREKHFPASLSPPCPVTSVKKQHPAIDDSDKSSSEVSKKRSKVNKDKMMGGKQNGMLSVLEECEISAVLQKGDEIPELLEGDGIMEEFESNEDHPVCCCREMSSNLSSPFLPSTSLGKRLPNPIKDAAYAQNSRSEGFKKKSIRRENEIMEDDIPVVLDKNNEIPQTFEEKAEIPTICEHEILTVLDEKDELLADWEEEEMLAFLRGDENLVVLGEDEISAVLGKEDELTEVFQNHRYPLLSGHLQNNKKREISSTRRSPSPFPSTSVVKSPTDPIKSFDDLDKISSKGSKKKNKKSKGGKNKIKEDKGNEITKALKERNKLMSILEGKNELPVILEEEIPFQLAVEDKMMQVLKTARITPPSHHYYLYFNENAKLTSSTHRSILLPSTSVDKMLLYTVQSVDNQDKTSSKGVKKKSSIREKINTTVQKYEVLADLEKKDEMKKVFVNDLLPPLLSGSHISLYNDDDEGKHDVRINEKERNYFPSIEHNFSKSVVLWNRWSLVSEGSIRNAVREISEKSKLRLKFSNFSASWSYGIATFGDVENARLCVKFFKLFEFNLKRLVDELKPSMNKEQRRVAESVRFMKNEQPVLAEMVFTWLRYIKKLETDTRMFRNVPKLVIVKNINPIVTYEDLKKFFSAFGKITNIKNFTSLKRNFSDGAEITFNRLFECCAATFAVDSEEWLQNKLSVMMCPKFRFFGTWIEHSFYPQLSNSFSFADIFELMQFNRPQLQLNRESNPSRACEEKQQQLPVLVLGEECQIDESQLSLKDNSAVFCGGENESGVKEKPSEMKSQDDGRNSLAILSKE